ncbi:MAG: hypothetical protein NZ898_02385 [Myxococcota bacterium]|nr:hypothetical protein [Myxococcota bacterium]
MPESELEPAPASEPESGAEPDPELRRGVVLRRTRRKRDGRRCGDPFVAFRLEPMRGSTCSWILVLAAVGCGDGTTPNDPPRFEVVLEDLPGALISVWGRSATEVWTVGGDEGGGRGPIVLRYDGSIWRRVSTGLDGGELWWVHGTSDGAVYVGGTGGVILRWRDGRFERMPTPGTDTVFGIWAAAPDDVWAVGGTGTSGAFAWRFDGLSWRSVALPDEVTDASLFKVWGRGRDDVWLCGSRGLLLHWNGERFERVASGTTRTLFTVHARDDQIAVVGGAGEGVVLEWREGGWQDATPRGAVMTMGVWLDAADGGWAVGLNGAMLRRERGRWVTFDSGIGVLGGLHAVWVDPDGGIWAVGGQVLARPLVDGTLLHAGAPVSRSIVDEGALAP